MRWYVLIASIVIVFAAPALAQVVRRGPAGTIGLPYSVADAGGNQWMIYPNGWLRQQGNMPLYGQAAQLIVNGSTPSANANQARLDEKTGELIFDGLNTAGVVITRRILINKNDSYVRYIDVLRNPTQQDVSVSIQINTNFNYGAQSSKMLEDPRKKDHPIGCAVQLQPGRAIWELYAGKGSKVSPQINVPQGNNVVQMIMPLSIPGGKQVAIMHLHGVSSSPETATQFVQALRESQITADLPLDLRKSLINIADLQSIGDREVLRGDVFDVVELRGGDQLKGTLLEKSYKLTTFYGAIELPAERVVALLSAGQFRPRQLAVTVDGEVFGGTLGKETIGIQLSSGQTTQVPLSQVARVGYRKRSGEPEEWSFDRPMISLRSGERMLVAVPTGPVDIMTRYGLLKLDPSTVNTIQFQSEEHGVHEIQLTDKSHFAALVVADRFNLQLVGTTSQQTVSFPAAAIARLQFATPSADDADEEAPSLRLLNRDQFVGTLAGELRLDTLFDTITINGAEVQSLSHAPDAGLDVQITLWDQTTLSGQLRDAQLTCALKCGASVQVPVPLIERYNNPQPAPSASMVERIKSVVVELSADDWKQRERAEAQIVAMGPMVVGILKQLSSAQPPEAQQRIESILKQLEKKPAAMPVLNKDE